MCVCVVCVSCQFGSIIMAEFSNFITRRVDKRKKKDEWTGEGVRETYKT